MQAVTAEEATEQARLPETVRLSVPADARYLSAVRLVAAALASDLDFTVDDIEELRMAVDEAVAVLISNAPERSSIAIEFTLIGDGAPCLHVEGALDREPAAGLVDPLAHRIVAAVVDRCALGAAAFTFEKSSSLG